MYMVNDQGRNYFEKEASPNICRIVKSNEFDLIRLRRTECGNVLKVSEFTVFKSHHEGIETIRPIEIGIHTPPGRHALRIFGNMLISAVFYRVKDKVRLRLRHLR